MDALGIEASKRQQCLLFQNFGSWPKPPTTPLSILTAYIYPALLQFVLHYQYPTSLACSIICTLNIVSFAPRPHHYNVHLELIWDATTTYNLWSWTDGKAHHTARLVRQIKNTVFIAHIGPHGAEPAQVVALKIAHGAEAVEELEREAGFYANQLKPLQGVVVPKCYGFYHAKINRTPLACLILEYCAGVPGEKLRDINRKAMRAAYAVHAAGVLHGDLLNGHHFVHMGATSASSTSRLPSRTSAFMTFRAAPTGMGTTASVVARSSLVWRRHMAPTLRLI